MIGYVNPENLEDLRARIRKREDIDIRQGLKQLGRLELNELSNMIRSGMRHELTKKGVLPNVGHYQASKDHHESMG